MKSTLMDIVVSRDAARALGLSELLLFDKRFTDLIPYTYKPHPYPTSPLHRREYLQCDIDAFIEEERKKPLVDSAYKSMLVKKIVDTNGRDVHSIVEDYEDLRTLAFIKREMRVTTYVFLSMFGSKLEEIPDQGMRGFDDLTIYGSPGIRRSTKDTGLYRLGFSLSAVRNDIKHGRLKRFLEGGKCSNKAFDRSAKKVIIYFKRLWD